MFDLIILLLDDENKKKIKNKWGEGKYFCDILCKIISSSPLSVAQTSTGIVTSWMGMGIWSSSVVSSSTRDYKVYRNPWCL